MIRALIQDWIAPLALIAWAITTIYLIVRGPEQPPASIPAAPKAVVAPAMPVLATNADAPILTGDLATPGLYAANHPHP